MLVFVPLLIPVSSGHGSFAISGDGENFEASGYVGPSGWQVTLILTALAVLVALVVARARGPLDTTGIRTAARRLQSFARPAAVAAAAAARGGAVE